MPSLRRTPTPTMLCALLGTLLAVSGCVSTGQRTLGSAPAPPFDAAAVFAGRTRGEGSLHILFRRPQSVVVASSGRVTADNIIIVDQAVRRGDRPATQRQWQLRQDRPGHYVGTLSDAVGPVVGVVDGNLLHLRFAQKGGLRADQWLTLQPGGAEVRNVMIIRKFGIAVARLDETIRRVEGAAPVK
ncbi:MAG: DUF3833 family protein [Sandarakinorhabdus sp.]